MVLEYGKNCLMEVDDQTPLGNNNIINKPEIKSKKKSESKF